MNYLDPEFSTLPDGWTSKTLQDVVEIHNTKRQPLNGREREGHKGIYPYCGANGVVDYIDDYRFDGEYVLIAEDGGYWGKHQPSSYIMRGKFWVNNHAHVVSAKDGETTNVFFSNIVNYLNIDPFIGGDARGKLTKAILTQLAIPLPPFPEQKKIAHILSAVQRAIEARGRIIQTTTELKKALMHRLFTEGLRNEPQKQTEIGPIPESWEVVAVGDICRSIVPGRNKPKNFDGDIPWLTTPNIKGLDYINADVDGLRVSPDELKSSGGRLIPKKSVIMSCVGEFGVSAVTNVEIVINQQLHAFVCSKNLNPVFLCNQLRYRKSYMQSIAAITTIPYLNKSKCESVPIALPGREEQDEIADALETLDSKRNQHIAHRQALQDLFRTFLHQLMTAKTRVHELELTA